MDMATFGVAVGLGFLLSLSTGLRAFLAPFALSVGSFAGWIDLGETMSWIGSPLALGTFSAAILFEMASDKIPVLDHLMDTLHVFLKPAAGTLVAMSLFHGTDPLVAAVLSLASGGAVAGVTHLTKASVRLGSSGTTGGTMNPVLSVVEDLVAVGLACLAAWGMS